MSLEIKNRIFLTKQDNIEKYENNLVTLKLVDGTVFEELEPRKLFPVSRVNSYITLIDTEGKEIAAIRGFDELNKESAEAIKESLDDYYLVPYISQIISVTEKNGTLVWVVDTNRGIKKFEVRDRNHDIRVYKDNSIRVRDADDNRYVIEDFSKLDKRSRYFLISDL